MTLIKNVFKIFAVTALFSTSSAFSSDFLVDTTIDDAVGDAAGGWVYEIEKMDVQWADTGLITVDIYTNFVDYNNENGTGGYYDRRGNWRSNGNIVLGDLLIGTGATSEPYDYAFVLSDADRQRQKYYEQDHWDNTGTLAQINSTVSSKEYHNNSSSVQNGVVMAGGIVDGTQRSSDWSVDRQNTGANHDNYDVISFNFNVTGIAAFQNASQLAFSWAMSCANDVVDGVVNVDRPNTTSVPEPATLLLVLIALGLMASSRKAKAKNFSA